MKPEDIEATLIPSGRRLPEPIRTLCSFLEVHGYPISGCFELSTIGMEDVRLALPQSPAVWGQFMPFGRGACGDVYAVWQRHGAAVDEAPIVLFGSEGEWVVLAPTALEFCRLLCIGYSEVGLEAPDAVPEDPESAADLRAFLVARYGFSVPPTGEAIRAAGQEAAPNFADLVNEHQGALADWVVLGKRTLLDQPAVLGAEARLGRCLPQSARGLLDRFGEGTFLGRVVLGLSGVVPLGERLGVQLSPLLANLVPFLNDEDGTVYGWLRDDLAALDEPPVCAQPRSLLEEDLRRAVAPDMEALVDRWVRCAAPPWFQVHGPWPRETLQCLSPRSDAVAAHRALGDLGRILESWSNEACTRSVLAVDGHLVVAQTVNPDHTRAAFDSGFTIAGQHSVSVPLVDYLRTTCERRDWVFD